MTAAVLRLAATAIPMRPSPAGFEVLMVRRNPDLSFAGLWTFPGGRLEPGDGSFPEPVDEDTQDWSDARLRATAAAAAVRETQEETGLTCDTTALEWLSHWIPPRVGGPPKRFATWFFLTAEPSGELVLDRTENCDAQWVRPTDALTAYGEGRLPAAVPTWVTLDHLCAYGTIDEALRAARAAGAQYFHTRAVRADDRRVLLWSGDDAYDGTTISEPGRRNRVVIDAAGVVESRELSR